MTPFLGIDLTSDKKNEQPNGKDFLIAPPSLALAQSLERFTDQAEETLEEAKLPRPLRILQFICGIVALVAAGGIAKADVSFSEGYENAPWVYLLGLVCLLIWLILTLLNNRKEKSVLGKEENTQVFDDLAQITDAVFTELNVPAHAQEVDILSFFYTTKDGEIKVIEKGLQMAKYLNPVYRVFADSENLYLANLDGKYAFPLQELENIRTVEKRISILNWNKEEPYNKGRYKQYKLTTDSYECIHCKKYHILEVRHEGELWGIYIPCYELPVFEALTGRKATEA